MSNTYYLPFSQKDIPEPGASREQIGYYQWIPMILICQAAMFYAPALLWRFLSARSGLNVKTVVHAALSCQRASSIETSDKTVRFIVIMIDSYLNSRPPENGGCWQRIKNSLSKKFLLICGRIYGNYLTFFYLVVKLVYLLNCVGQLFLLGVFLGTDYHMYGLRVAVSLLRAQDWKSSHRFPRVTLCDFEVSDVTDVSHISCH